MRRLLAVVALALVASGCGNSRWSVSDARLVEPTQLAIAAWTGEWPEIRVNDESAANRIEIADNSGPDGSVICIDANGIEQHDEWTGASTIRICSDLVGDQLQRVVNHEIGHSFGLLHDVDGSNSVMLGGTDPRKTKIIWPTDHDLDRLAELQQVAQ